MNCRKRCSIGCICTSLAISVIFAAITGILFFFRLIPNMSTAVWIAFGFGVLNLVLLFIGLFRGAACPCGILSRCLCAHSSCLLAGSFGTIITALAALSIVLAPAVISITILVSIGAFFTALTLLTSLHSSYVSRAVYAAGMNERVFYGRYRVWLQMQPLPL